MNQYRFNKNSHNELKLNLKNLNSNNELSPSLNLIFLLLNHSDKIDRKYLSIKLHIIIIFNLNIVNIIYLQHLLLLCIIHYYICNIFIINFK